MSEIPVGKIEQPVEKRALELFLLTDEQKLVLKERVAEFGGLVRVFVHPMPDPEETAPIKNMQRVTDILAQTIYLPSTPPIIILENATRVPMWGQELEPGSHLPHDIYVVPTIRDHSYPLMPGTPGPSEMAEDGSLKEEDYEYAEKGFEKLVEFFKEIGVKTVFVGGTNLDIIEGDINQCVGSFIKIIQEYDIRVKLSSGTAPLDREDVRHSHPELL
jgi:hypothetical protein